LEFPCFIVIFS